MHNVARLWTIGQQAKSDQDILDALHPWNDNKELYFYNNLPRLLFISGVLTCLFGWVIHHYIPFILSFSTGALCCFLAYLIYESDEPINEVIAFLEERIMLLRYDLHFNKMPGHITTTSNSTTGNTNLAKHPCSKPSIPITSYISLACMPTVAFLVPTATCHIKVRAVSNSPTTTFKAL